MSTLLKILVVEDDTITAMDIKETLEEAGHIVTDTARNYEEAIASVQNLLPDLAIIDIALENSAADGIITAEKIQMIHPLPIIYLTGNSESKTFERAKETIPVAYLLKPFDQSELIMQIEIVWNFYKSKYLTNKSYIPEGLFFTIKNKGQHRIIPNEVIYIEAESSSSKIYTIQRKSPYEVSMNLSNVSNYFDTPNFFRLSRAFLINLDHLERIEDDKIYFKEHDRGLPIPVGVKPTLSQKIKIIKTK